VVLAAGCAPAPGTSLSATAPATPVAETGPTIAVTGSAPAPATLPAIEPGPAPTQRFAVQRREITVTRDGRSLRTVILFPATPGTPPTPGTPTTSGTATAPRARSTSGAPGPGRPTTPDTSATSDPAATPDAGRGQTPPGGFPLVLFSHGLRGSPEAYEPSLRTIAAAGFVVAAPEYPHTSEGAAEYNPVDLINQPADASAVITAVLTLSATTGDPLAGHVDSNRIAAMGHSAGGYTTMGLLSGFRDHRVRAAVVLAGASLGGSYADPAVPVLFVHGEADTVVPYAHGRATYDYLPWPKAFLTVIDGGHTDFLDRDSRAATAVTETVVDFLRAMLYGDILALARVPTAATVESVTRFESALDGSARPPAEAR
jgi:dienelactone hydrolase